MNIFKKIYLYFKYSKQIDLSIKWLNINYGWDWIYHIDLEKLDINSTTRCIIGQLYDDYIFLIEKGIITSINRKTFEGFFGSADYHISKLQTNIWKKKIINLRRGAEL